MGNDSIEFFRARLGDLADSAAFHAPIDLGDFNRKKLIQQAEQMALIRLVEEQIGVEVSTGLIKCPCHLAIGQEAVPVAVSACLELEDRVFGTHRSHGHFLAKGGTARELFAEILGKVTGCSKGFGGSMHLYKEEVGFMGSVPIVSATVSLGVGAALAAKMENKNRVAVSYFGDGAMEEGSVHESLNFASVYQLPMIFVVENNLFSSHLHIDLRQPYNSVSRFAAANGMVWEVVDGNDVVAVEKATARLVRQAKEGGGPGFLEAVTYRWRGHVGPREDEDVGVKRKDDLAKWKLRDPISRLIQSLEKDGSLKKGEWQAILERMSKQIKEDWQAALDAPYPSEDLILSTVYKRPRGVGRA